ncbi:Cullin repeat-like-containing domain [Pseudocohnilembus persalinus]|uniref:Cullin repeat-like-containing domain n=1 Tax=Pseudocohnilembus persalinus TaxID=266149 RepID=A0A0V0QX27_PSEPJ|nr:Cullin repeat-like-containing domain [Pseudocohnilembus persalinus]|eukprot:KRX06953.1 Cullin repeat-like-containing domain [Pseudocohnilembus persalinus]
MIIQKLLIKLQFQKIWKKWQKILQVEQNRYYNINKLANQMICIVYLKEKKTVLSAQQHKNYMGMSRIKVNTQFLIIYQIQIFIDFYFIFFTFNYFFILGKKFISDRDLTKKPLEYIKTVISFKEEVDDIVKNHLENNIIYQNARDSSFKVFLNKFDKTVRYLAMHTDKELKSDLKGLQDEEVDQRIQSIKGIFLYLYSKDQFIQDYSVYLSKRLLNQTSISDDWENKMISSLKAETGHTMVFKLTQMCQDVQLSKSKIKPEFKEYLQNNLSELEKQQNNIEANIMVLTRSLWPIKSDFSKLPKIPDQLQHIVKHFENYYGQNFAKNRRLQFLLKEGKSEIKAQFQNQKKILIVSNFQLSILLTFNNVIGEKITYGNLLLSTQIPGDEIREHLLSLIKLKILEREDQDLLAPIKNEEKISVNENFTNQQMKIKCIPGKEFHKKPEANTEQEKINQEQINQQRNYVIEATIVRVMKSKRVLTVNEICQDTISLINMFKPEIKNIKERIDDLIAREYLQRDEKNKASIIYKP